MKSLLSAISIFTLLAFSTANINARSLEYQDLQEVQSFFSHTVLNLPYNLKSEEPWVRVIRTQEEWDAFFDEVLKSNQFLLSPIVQPVIDFNTYQVVTGGLGVKMTGGYSLLVESIYEYEDTVNMHIYKISPGKYCLVTMALTYPVTTVLVKKSDKPITFSFSQLISECPPF